VEACGGHLYIGVQSSATFCPFEFSCSLFLNLCSVFSTCAHIIFFGRPRWCRVGYLFRLFEPSSSLSLSSWGSSTEAGSRSSSTQVAT
jgi:hypothetical protein